MKINSLLFSVQPLLLIAVVSKNVEYISTRGENTHKTYLIARDDASRLKQGGGAWRVGTNGDLLTFPTQIISLTLYNNSMR